MILAAALVEKWQKRTISNALFFHVEKCGERESVRDHTETCCTIHSKSHLSACGEKQLCVPVERHIPVNEGGKFSGGVV